MFLRGALLLPALLLTCFLCICVTAQQQLQQAGRGEAHSIELEIKGAFMFVGVQTTYGHERERKTLRQAWFPSSQAALEKLQEKHSVALRFVLGWTPSAEHNSSLQREAEQHGGFFMLPCQELKQISSAKTHAFLMEAVLRTDAEYVVRMDESTYLRPVQLGMVARQWRDSVKDYIGCFFKGARVQTEGQWAERHHSLLPHAYHTYAQGGIYALSRRALVMLAQMPHEAGLRYFNSEDVTVGMWMVLLAVSHFDDPRLCQLSCSNTAVALHQMWCGTQENPCWAIEYQVDLHNKPECEAPPPVSDYKYFPMLQSSVNFDRGRRQYRRYRGYKRRPKRKTAPAEDGRKNEETS